MGSSGSGNFSDYSGKPNQPTGGGGSSGGSSGSDLCRQAVSAGLEDIAEYDFFTTTGGVPPVGTQLTLAHRGRVVAVSANDSIVGALPTRYNYLASCLKDGIRYTGVVTASASGPVPRVNADFAAD
jgi:hypothetical protein